jgi:hypothetical protein
VVEKFRLWPQQVSITGNAQGERLEGRRSWERRTLGSAGNRRAMLRADGPAEGDDSKETNIAVVLLTTDTMVDEESPMIKVSQI